MEYIDNFHPTEENDYNEMDQKELDELKKMDRGYNKIYRKFVNDKGYYKKNKIEVYTSGSQGSQIRDAETGDRYPYTVGSKDEFLFFKVCLSTGECKSKNGSTVLFFLSPKHFCTHMHNELSDVIIEKWNEKRDMYEIEKAKELRRKTRSKVVLI